MQRLKKGIVIMINEEVIQSSFNRHWLSYDSHAIVIRNAQLQNNRNLSDFSISYERSTYDTIILGTLYFRQFYI
jgi:hypothetical protein